MLARCTRCWKKLAADLQLSILKKSLHCSYIKSLTTCASYGIVLSCCRVILLSPNEEYYFGLNKYAYIAYAGECQYWVPKLMSWSAVFVQMITLMVEAKECHKQSHLLFRSNFSGAQVESVFRICVVFACFALKSV